MANANCLQYFEHLPPHMSVEIPRYRTLLTDHGQHTMLARVMHHAGRFARPSGARASGRRRRPGCPALVHPGHRGSARSCSVLVRLAATCHLWKPSLFGRTQHFYPERRVLPRLATAHA